MAAGGHGETQRRKAASTPAQPATGRVQPPRTQLEDRKKAATPSRSPKAVKPEHVVAAVQALAEPVMTALSLELDRIEYLDRGPSAVLQVFIDRPGGVNVQDCANVSRELSPVLDVHDVIPKAYTLEVSSPGLTRPLKGEADLRRFTGRRASLTLRRAVEGGSKLTGHLRGVDEGMVAVELKDGRVVKVELELVAKARLEPEE